MKKQKFAGLIAILVLPVLLFAQGGKNYGMFAPRDAYLPGSKYPYYGSENEWSRRMFSEKAANKYYKRRGQRQLLAILDGHPERTVELCKTRLKENPSDGETLYMLAVAYSQLNQIKAAWATMKRALKSGLPLERFLSGPRELLKPLSNSAEFRKYFPVSSGRLIHGPLLGSVTDHSARFWVRTLGEDTVTVRVFQKSESGNYFHSTPTVSGKNRDYSVIAEVDGLSPDTDYYYDILINGVSALQPSYPPFRTFPRQGTSARFKIAFGGGAGYTPKYQYMWNTIHKQNLTALLLLGDNVYIDLPEHPGTFHRYTYYRLQSSPPFRNLTASTPVFAIWDDHDAGIDDIWMGPYLDKPAWKLPLLRIFKNNWNNPAYGTDKTPGTYFKFSIADVDFFMLDCRFYRTNPFAPTRTMLGSEQKAWLFNQLAKSKATFKVIVSSVPWAYDSKPNSKDTWNGFRQEREEIFNFLTRRRIGGVILLSADRHRSEAWKINRQNDYPLYEFESSKLTNMHTHALVPGAIFGYNKKCSFGTLRFDTLKKNPEVRYQIVNIDGEVINSITLKRNELKFQPKK